MLTGVIETMGNLISNPDFITFTKYIRVEASKAGEKAKDAERFPTAEQRDAFAQRHIAITEVVNFAEGRFDDAQSEIRKIDEKIASLRPVDAQA